ncbi:MAG: hypothetical protein HQM11_05030 [SAR324 cluster bacterium]|nr:hypothetical protein [SAR324 cluster bacterium]
MPTKMVEIDKVEEQFQHLMILALKGNEILISKESKPVLKLIAIEDTVEAPDKPQPKDQQAPLTTGGTLADQETLVLEQFMEEVVGSLITIDLELEKLRNHPEDSKQIDMLYSIFHKIKYHCNIISSKKLRLVSESTESLIEQIQMHRHELTDVPVELIQQSADAFLAIIRNLLRDRTEGSTNYAPLLQKLRAETRRIRDTVAS